MGELLSYLSELSYHSGNGIFYFKRSTNYFFSQIMNILNSPIETYKDTEETSILLKI